MFSIKHVCEKVTKEPTGVTFDTREIHFLKNVCEKVPNEPTGVTFDTRERYIFGKKINDVRVR